MLEEEGNDSTKNTERYRSHHLTPNDGQFKNQLSDTTSSSLATPEFSLYNISYTCIIKFITPLLLVHVINTRGNELSRQPVQTVMQSITTLCITCLNMPAMSAAQFV